MIILILGETGAGKTSFGYSLAIKEMYNKVRLKSARNIVYQLIEGGYKNLRLPDDHIVYTDTAVTGRLFGHRPRFSYLCSGRRFGLPTKTNNVDFYPPYAFIIFDEGQKDVDSRNFRNLQDYVKRGWETNRHMEYTIVYISQTGNVDKILRDIANKIYVVVGKGQKFSEGKYKHIQSFWKYIEFDCFSNYEKWVSEGKPNLEEKTSLFDGNIQRCVDGHAFMPLWFRGRENSDFTKIKTKKVEMTVKSFNEFIKNIGDF